MNRSLDDWQFLQRAQERGRAETVERLERNKSDVERLLDSLPPCSGVTCQSPTPSNIQILFEAMAIFRERPAPKWAGDS
jgi:hypothetical protein